MSGIWDWLVHLSSNLEDRHPRPRRVPVDLPLGLRGLAHRRDLPGRAERVGHHRRGLRVATRRQADPDPGVPGGRGGRVVRRPDRVLHRHQGGRASHQVLPAPQGPGGARLGGACAWSTAARCTSSPRGSSRWAGSPSTCRRAPCASRADASWVWTRSRRRSGRRGASSSAPRPRACLGDNLLLSIAAGITGGVLLGFAVDKVMSLFGLERARASAAHGARWTTSSHGQLATASMNERARRRRRHPVGRGASRESCQLGGPRPATRRGVPDRRVEGRSDHLSSVVRTDLEALVAAPAWQDARGASTCATCNATSAPTRCRSRVRARA